MQLAINQLVSLGRMKTNDTKSEASLIARLVQGERKAYNECYRLFSGKMYPTAIRYTSTRADADEVINTSFLKVFNSIKNYNFAGSFEGWIRTIVRRTSIDHCRKYTYNQPDTFELLEIDLLTYNEAIDNLSAEDFLQLIVLLPKASRTVFNMFAIEGYSHKEISVELNISTGTSKWHVSNARKLLIELLKKS